MITADEVRDFLSRTGLKQGQLAERIGVSQPTVSRWLKGAVPDPAQEEALRGVMSEAPSEKPTPTKTPRQSQGVTEAPDAPEVDKSLYPRDVPLHGIAACGRGEDAGFTLNGQTGDHVRRPPGLQGKRSVYALNLYGDSMWPAYRHGALVYIDPTREPGPDEDALIELFPDDPTESEPGKGFVKRVKSVRAGKITCQQFNPVAEVTFDRADVKSFHRVIPWEEVLGY